MLQIKFRKNPIINAFETSSVGQWVNSLGPSDGICRQRSGSTLAPVMACCLMAPSHIWTNVDWSSTKSNDIHIRAISQEKPQPSITKICLKIICLKFHSNFPGVNELTRLHRLPCHWISNVAWGALDSMASWHAWNWGQDNPHLGILFPMVWYWGYISLLNWAIWGLWELKGAIKLYGILQT